MSLDSTVGLARPQAKSLRATVPEGIVAYLGIHAGDKLLWTMENGEDGERIVIVRKAKLPSSSTKQIQKHK
jgi:bifunctional DNA-binding transcriptional regulator/antitoxin component of YhaV-PrlF toxin-antitoxin module